MSLRCTPLFFIVAFLAATLCFVHESEAQSSRSYSRTRLRSGGAAARSGYRSSSRKSDLYGINVARRANGSYSGFDGHEAAAQKIKQDEQAKLQEYQQMVEAQKKGILVVDPRYGKRVRGVGKGRGEEIRLARQEERDAKRAEREARSEERRLRREMKAEERRLAREEKKAARKSRGSSDDDSSEASESKQSKEGKDAKEKKGKKGKKSKKSKRKDGDVEEDASGPDDEPPAPDSIDHF